MPIDFLRCGYYKQSNLRVYSDQDSSTLLRTQYAGRLRMAHFVIAARPQQLESVRIFFHAETDLTGTALLVQTVPIFPTKAILRF
jgi:hypothetical protein